MSASISAYDHRGREIRWTNWLRNGIGLGQFLVVNTGIKLSYADWTTETIPLAMAECCEAMAILLAKPDEDLEVELAVWYPISLLSPHDLGLVPKRVVRTRGGRLTAMFPFPLVWARYRLSEVVAAYTRAEPRFWHGERLDKAGYVVWLGVLMDVLAVAHRPGNSLVVSA